MKRISTLIAIGLSLGNPAGAADVCKFFHQVQGYDLRALYELDAYEHLLSRLNSSMKPTEQERLVKAIEVLNGSRNTPEQEKRDGELVRQFFKPSLPSYARKADIDEALYSFVRTQTLILLKNSGYPVSLVPDDQGINLEIHFADPSVLARLEFDPGSQAFQIWIEHRDPTLWDIPSENYTESQARLAKLESTRLKVGKLGSVFVLPDGSQIYIDELEKAARSRACENQGKLNK